MNRTRRRSDRRDGCQMAVSVLRQHPQLQSWLLTLAGMVVVEEGAVCFPSEGNNEKSSFNEGSSGPSSAYKDRHCQLALRSKVQVFYNFILNWKFPFKASNNSKQTDPQCILSVQLKTQSNKQCRIRLHSGCMCIWVQCTNPNAVGQIMTSGM